MASKAEKIVAGLGGLDNIEEVEGCITRLRTEVVDPSLVDEAALKAPAPTASSRWAPRSRSSSAPTPTPSPPRSKT